MKEHLHDALLNLAAHPIAWPLARLSRWWGRVHRLPIVGVLVNGADVAHDLLTRDDDFTKNGEGSIARVMTQAFGPSALANMDGDAHRALRTRLGDILAPARCDGLLAASRQPLDQATGQLIAGRAVDVAAMMRVLSGRLTMTMIGIPHRDEGGAEAARDIHALGERIASALQLRLLSERRLARVRADLDRLTGYADDAFRSPVLPAGSLVGRLRELGLSREEARGVLSIFFVAGALTIGVALPRIVALLIDSRQMQRLESAEAVARAVDEGLRFAAPVPATVRIVARDAVLDGLRVRRGERIVVLTANVARDAALFPDPDQFDVGRVHDSRARHLWYGAGPHFCFGFPLAQRALRLCVERLAALPGELRVVRRRPAFGVLLPAYASLVVRLERSCARP